MATAEDPLQYEHAVADIAGKVRESKCILFLGAGAHYPPPEESTYCYPEQERPPSGSALSQSLAKECSFGDKFPNDSIKNLQRVSLCYEVTFSRNQLVNRIRGEVDEGRKPSPAILKIHGSVEKPESIVVTDEVYIQFLLRMSDKDPYHPIPETFRYHLK